jgi:hypothetical protein
MRKNPIFPSPFEFFLVKIASAHKVTLMTLLKAWHKKSTDCSVLFVCLIKVL